MSIEEEKNAVFSFNEQSDDEVEESKKDTDNLELKTETKIENKHEEVTIKVFQTRDNNMVVKHIENQVHGNSITFAIQPENHIQADQYQEVQDEDHKKMKKKSPVRFHKMDMDDFKRIEIKRNSRKTKTEVPIKKTFNIEKFTEEITKITEDLEIEDVKEEIEQKPTVFEQTRKNEKKKTIRFHNKKTTFQYPKEVELSKDVEGLGPDVLIEGMPGHATFNDNVENSEAN